MDLEALCKEVGVERQADLARKLGVTQTYLSDLKAGRRGISLRFARAIERETGRRGLVEAIVAERTAA